MIWLSHGRRELVEGCLDAVAGGDVGGDCMVAAAQILDEGMPGGDDPRGPVWVPRSSSTSRDQAVFVDQATDASLSSDPVLPGIDRFG